MVEFTKSMLLLVTIHVSSLVKYSWSPVITYSDLVSTMLTPTICPRGTNFHIETVELADTETAAHSIGVCKVIG